MAGNGNGSGTGNGKADGAARKPITVLIVDDERTFGEALEVALDREKDLRVVHVATDGVEAVASATEFRPRRRADGRLDARDERARGHEADQASATPRPPS